MFTDQGGSEDTQTLWVGTSWKMTKTLSEARAYVRELLRAPLPNNLNVFILPAHTALASVRADVPSDSPLRIGAQNAHWASDGAATGEVSMRMVADAGASIVEIGHSERREGFCETDDRVSRKVRAAIDHALVPLICVGEPQGVREGGGAVEFVTDQVSHALSRLAPAERAAALIAYEPIWAIGDGGRPASGEQVAPVIAAIAAAVAAQSEGRTPRGVLYGGSVNADNLAGLLSVPLVGGVFVGRAAWDASAFRRLLDIAAGLRTA